MVATATGELAGTTTSATYGAPYNHASEGQSVLGLKLQKWGGVRHPGQLRRTWCSSRCASVPGDPGAQPALAAVGRAAAGQQQTAAATAYADALAKAPDGDPAQVPPRPLRPGARRWPTASCAWPRSGGLEGSLTSSGTFYGGDQTRAHAAARPTAPTSRTPRSPTTSAATSGA